MTLKGQTQGNQVFKALYLVKGAKLGHMLVLHINRNTYMGIPMALSPLTLSDLEGQVKVTRFRRLISHKGPI